MPSGTVVYDMTEGEREVAARVYVRLRPLNLGVIEKLAHPAYSISPDGALLLSLPNADETAERNTFVFRVNGKVFDENAGNTTIYVEAIQPLVLQASEGISSLIIAYGSSGSGKSHSLFGTLEAPGLVPSAICDLFSHIASYDNKASAFEKPLPAAAVAAAFSGPGGFQHEISRPSEFNIRISYVEVRGEQIGDLLRASEGYSPGQRIPTVAPKKGSKRRGITELEGLREVDLSTLEDAILLVAKASAFKKARDAVLGGAGAHSVFRIVVERAVCRPRERERKEEEEGTEEPEKEEATVLKAELTFVEAGGVETLIAVPAAGGERFNRSLFFLTEVLLRMAEDPSTLSTFDWNCSAATCLLRELLLSPGHLAFLVSVDPSDRYTPVSLPVLRFASRLCALKNRMEHQKIDPKRSRLFALHREVLHQSECLILSLSSLRKKGQKIVKAKRDLEWWAPSKEDRVRAVAELQEKVREEQAKILLAGQEDWKVLEGARLSKLGLIFQRLRNNREFLRQALETDAQPQSFIPHMASPRAFSARREPSPPPIKDIHLRTKEKPTVFVSMVDVSIHLKSDTRDANKEARKDPFNLTASLFEETLGVPDDVGSGGRTSLPYPYTKPSSLVQRLFTSRLSSNYPSSQRGPNGVSEAPWTPQQLSEAPPEFLGLAVPHMPKAPNGQWAPNGELAPNGLPRVSVPPIALPGGSPRPSDRPLEEVEEMGPSLEFEAQRSEESWGSIAGANMIEVIEENGMIPEGGAVTEEPPNPPVLENQKNGGAQPAEKMQAAPTPRTPLGWESREAFDEEDEREKKFYFNVEWTVQASPATQPKEPPHGQGTQEGPLSLHLTESRSQASKGAPSGSSHQGAPEVDPDSMYQNTSGATKQGSSTGGANNGINGASNNASKGAPANGSKETHSSSSSKGISSSNSKPVPSSSSGSKEVASRDNQGTLNKGSTAASQSSGKSRFPQGDSTGGGESKKLLKEASSLRSEVMGLILQTTNSRRSGASKGSKASTDEGPMPGGLFLASSSGTERNSKGLSLERRASTSVESGKAASPNGPQQQAKGASQHKGQEPSEGQATGPPQEQHGQGAPQCYCHKTCMPPPCGSYCVHAHAPLSPLNGTPTHAGWVVGPPQGMLQGPCPAGGIEHPTEKGPTQPAWPQMLMMPPGVPMSPWGPAIVASPVEGPALYMPCPHPYPGHPPGPGADSTAEGPEPLKPPQLTAADHRLPRFKASKGGASWEISAPRAAAVRAAAAAAAQEKEEKGFCLPEEPRRPRRVTDTKSDLLLQGTLRPWTRERDTRQGPPRAPRGRGSGSGALRLQRPSRSPCGRVSELQKASLFAKDRDGRRLTSNVETVQPAPTGCCQPSWLGSLAEMCPPTGPFPGPLLARSCWLQFKGQGKLGGTSDSEKGPSGPSTNRHREDPDSRASSCSPRPRGPQASPNGGRSRDGGPQTQRKGCRLEIEATANYRAATPREHLQRQHQQPQQQQQQQQQQPPQQQAQQQQGQQHGQHQPQQQTGFSTPERVPVVVGAHQASPPPTARTLPDVSPLPQGPPANKTPMSLPITLGVIPPTARVAPSQSVSPRFYPPYPNPQRVPSPQTPGYPQQAPPQWGAPAVSPPGYRSYPPGTYPDGASYNGVPSFQCTPGAYRYLPEEGLPLTPRTPYPSGSPPWPWGGAPAPAAPPQAPLKTWGPNSFEGGSMSMCGGIPGGPHPSAAPARIVRVVSRTKGGLPLDLELGSETTRTIYPTEEPLNIPISRADLRPPSNLGAPQVYPRSWAPSGAAGTGTQGAPAGLARGPVPLPGYGGWPPPELIPGRVWAYPVYKPGGPPREGGAFPSPGPSVLPSEYRASIPVNPPEITPPKTIIWSQLRPRASPQIPRPIGLASTCCPMSAPEAPTTHPVGPRSHSVGPGQAAIPHSAPPTALRRGRGNTRRADGGEPSERIPVTLGEDGQAGFFEECLDALNERVGRFYARRPRLPVQEQGEGKIPCPFKRRSRSRASTREATEMPSRQTSRGATPTPRGKSWGPPYSCELSASFGFGVQ